MLPLSSLIVQREIATMRTVEEAIARQVLHGGDLVTNLMEIAAVNEAALARAMADSLGLLPAPADRLAQPHPEAVAMLTGERAAKYGILPLARTRHEVTVAVAEPLSAAVREDLGFPPELNIEQVVASLPRIHEAIARVYRVPLDKRYARLLTRLSGGSTRAPSTPPGFAVARAPSLPPPSFSPGRMASSTSEPGSMRPPASSLQTSVELFAGAARRVHGPITFEEVKNRLSAVTTSDQALEAFFDFASQFFSFSAMFVAHGDLAEGRDAAGAGPSRDRIASVGIPLDLPSVLSFARDRRALVVASLGWGGVDAELRRHLMRPKELGTIAILPLALRDRVVALFYGDDSSQDVNLAQDAPVLVLAAMMPAVFEQVLRLKKLGRGTTPAPGTATTDPIITTMGGGGADDPAVPFVELSEIGSLTESMPKKESGAPLALEPSPMAGRTTAKLSALTEAEMLEDGWSRTRFSQPPEPAIETNWSDASESVVAMTQARPSTPPPAVASGAPRSSARAAADIEALIDRLLEGGPESNAAFGQLSHGGTDVAARVMARFPGAVPYGIEEVDALPAAKHCSLLLELVVALGAAALPHVIERSTALDETTRMYAVHVLGELPFPEAGQAIAARLFDDSIPVRKVALRSASALANHTGSVRFLLEHVDSILRDPSSDPDHRSLAIDVVAGLRQPEGVPSLIAVLEDPDSKLAEEAARALSALTGSDFGISVDRWHAWWLENSARHRVEWLIDALAHDSSTLRQMASEELKQVTKEYFGYYADLPRRERERAQERYREWWQAEGKARFGDKRSR